MYTVRADQPSFSFRPDAKPVLRVEDGASARLETSAAPVERLLAAGDRWLNQFDAGAINALTGPVFIEGVEPGDTVAVEVLAIETLDWGWNAFVPRFGALGLAAVAPYLRRLPIRDGLIELSPGRSVPVGPMIGCLGLAPASGECSTLSPPYPWGGNYDLSQIAPGSTILFPAQVAGGLFSLGDLHAAMGDGEGTGVAIECAGAATVRLAVRPGLRLVTPRLETPDRLFVVGLDAGRDYHVARQQALSLLFAYLTEERGLAGDEAITLIAARGDLAFGGPAAAVVLANVPWNVLD
ncbi:MAG: acetamidase/formamidase family protein [Chloroflexota bacterium]|nr:acetamidase/formamidase family protein [Chloroflexota bacterium]